MSSQTPWQKRLPSFLKCGVVLVGLFLVILFYGRKGSDSASEMSADFAAPREFTDEKLLSRKLPNGVFLDAPSDFAKSYGSPESTVQRDLEILEEILGRAVVLIKDFANLPLAENRDFANLLIGNNQQNFAWIRPDHPSLNAEGELMDRFGTPIFFHRESALRTEIRSAGEDRTMWTEDDVFLAPG